MSPLIQIGNSSASQGKDRAVYSSQTLLDLCRSAFLTLVQYTIWPTSVMSHILWERKSSEEEGEKRTLRQRHTLAHHK